MNRVIIELWDVLCIFGFSLMQSLVGLQYAWPVTAVAAGIASVDRDLTINEVASAAYMLRQACGAARVATGPTIIITLYAGAISCCAHAKKYLSLHHTIRRASVLCALATSTLLLHGYADPAWLSVLRLLVFVAVTRYDIAVSNIDPWDTTAQNVWLLIVPWYALPFSMVYPVFHVKTSKSAASATSVRRRDPYYENIL